MKSFGQENAQYFPDEEHIQFPYGKLGFVKLGQSMCTCVVVDGIDVVVNFGLHLNPSRDSNPSAKSNLEWSEIQVGWIFIKVQCVSSLVMHMHWMDSSIDEISVAFFEEEN